MRDALRPYGRLIPAERAVCGVGWVFLGAVGAVHDSSYSRSVQLSEVDTGCLNDAIGVL